MIKHFHNEKDIWKRSIIIALLLAVLMIIGVGISMTPIELSIGFLGALVTVFVVNSLYDYLTESKFFHLESLGASLVVVLFAYTTLALLGGNAINPSLLSIIEIIIIASIYEYVGVLAVHKLFKK